MVQSQIEKKEIDEFALGLDTARKLLWQMYQMVGQGHVTVKSRREATMLLEWTEEVERELGL